MDSANACGSPINSPKNLATFPLNPDCNLWNEYEDWLLQNKNRAYARVVFRTTKKYYHLAFTQELVNLPNSRKKEDILKAISNLTRFYDIKYDTYLHEDFLKWVKRKELKWKTSQTSINHQVSEQVKLEDVLERISKLPEKYRIFTLFMLVSGLRTGESVKVFNEHSSLCNDGVIEMYWDRGTKKSNAVYCHPLLHNEILKHKIRPNMLYRNIRIGCELRYLRKLNFTLVATKLDPLLAEFMQGRRGNISQRHYFIPMMNKNKRKWIRLWDKTCRFIFRANENK